MKTYNYTGGQLTAALTILVATILFCTYSIHYTLHHIKHRQTADMLTLLDYRQEDHKYYLTLNRNLTNVSTVLGALYGNVLDSDVYIFRNFDEACRVLINEEESERVPAQFSIEIIEELGSD